MFLAAPHSQITLTFGPTLPARSSIRSRLPGPLGHGPPWWTKLTHGNSSRWPTGHASMKRAGTATGSLRAVLISVRPRGSGPRRRSRPERSAPAKVATQAEDLGSVNTVLELAIQRHMAADDFDPSDFLRKNTSGCCRAVKEAAAFWRSQK